MGKGEWGEGRGERGEGRGKREEGMTGERGREEGRMEKKSVGMNNVYTCMCLVTYALYACMYMYMNMYSTHEITCV